MGWGTAGENDLFFMTHRGCLLCVAKEAHNHTFLLCLCVSCSSQQDMGRGWDSLTLSGSKGVN